jgi:hypothetical protein
MLSETEWHVVHYMHGAPRDYYSPAQLARGLGRSMAQMQCSLVLLEAAGYVQPRSPRVPLYVLTPAGLQVPSGVAASHSRR